MLKKLWFILLLSLASLIANGQLSLQDIRKEYVEAAEDKKKADKFHERLSNNDNQTGILQAYRAAAEALLGKHAFFVTRKVAYVKRSLRMFEEAVRKDPENIEIRYLRFSIEHHLPAFLGMSDHLQEDVQHIVKNACKASEYSIDKEYLSQMIEFLIESGRCNDSDENQLKQCLN
ncbi:MAG TPA: hypothetical protein VIK89_09530 [Cytophagaceae bacterium]